MAGKGDAPVSLAQVRAIALPARVRVLRALGRRPHTLAELVREVGLPKSSVANHVAALERVGLLTRRKQGPQWVYVTLTPLGRAVVATHPMRLVVMAAASVLAVGAFYSMLSALALRGVEPIEDGWFVDPIDASPPFPVLRVAASALVLVVALSVLWLQRRRRIAGASRVGESTD